MPISSTSTAGDGLPPLAGAATAVPAGAVSWGAILAGAAAAAALSLILLFLGTGLGLSAASPWAGRGISAETFGTSTIVWICLTQLIASGLGGYLAGRLRVRWLQTQADEVFFRDTAHGLLTWAVATLATAALLGSIIGSIVQGGAQAGASLAGNVSGAVASSAAASADQAGDNDTLDYFVDSLFREDPQALPATAGAEDPALARPVPADTEAARAEVLRIFVRTMHNGSLSAADRSYVGQRVAARTGLPQQQAEERVSAMVMTAQNELQAAQTAARAAADEARKASAKISLWLFISLLIGAFVASYAATVGGRQRDQY